MKASQLQSRVNMQQKQEAVEMEAWELALEI